MPLDWPLCLGCSAHASGRPPAFQVTPSSPAAPSRSATFVAASPCSPGLPCEPRGRSSSDSRNRFHLTAANDWAWSSPRWQRSECWLTTAALPVPYLPPPGPWSCPAHRTAFDRYVVHLPAASRNDVRPHPASRCAPPPPGGALQRCQSK